MRWPADRLDLDAYAEPGLDLMVFYGDLDTNRHVNNVSLGRYFEQARFEIHRSVGMNRVAAEFGGQLLVARVAIDYLAEVHYGIGPLHLRVRIRDIGRTSMTEEQAAWQDGKCVALAEVVVVYRENGEGAPWPERIRAGMAKLRGPGDPAQVQ